MSEDNREKILQQNMLNLFKYIEEIESRVRVLEEEHMRYDFGYDPVETLRKRFEKMAGFDIWKAKFALDPDKDPAMKAVLEDESNKFTQHPEVVSVKPMSAIETREQWLVDKDVHDFGEKRNNLWNPKT